MLIIANFKKNDLRSLALLFRRISESRSISIQVFNNTTKIRGQQEKMQQERSNGTIVVLSYYLVHAAASYQTIDNCAL